MNEHAFDSNNQKNTKKLAIWTLLWVSSMAIATFGPEFIWESKVLTITGIVINALLGVIMILVNIKYISGLDDLQKKIQLDAMGIALGVGVIGGLSYSLLDTTNVIKGDAEISYLVIVISITYLIAIFVGQKRYS
ncbi:MAG: hypothetical protein ACPGRE_09795 [Flavobacteriaceae bacterium]